MGIGIAPSHIPYIFQRFYRIDGSYAMDSGNSGLGLAITQAIVHTHKGVIQVKSVLGKGSSFIIDLPCLP